MRRLIFAVVTAIVLSVLLAVPSIRGVSTWKYVLAAIGLLLFFAAERGRSTKT